MRYTPIGSGSMAPGDEQDPVEIARRRMFGRGAGEANSQGFAPRQAPPIAMANGLFPEYAEPQMMQPRQGRPNDAAQGSPLPVMTTAPSGPEYDASMGEGGLGGAEQGGGIGSMVKGFGKEMLGDAKGAFGAIKGLFA